MPTTRRRLFRFAPLAALAPLATRLSSSAPAALRVSSWSPPTWNPVCTLIDLDGSQITASRIAGVFADARPLQAGRDFTINASGWGLEVAKHVQDWRAIFIHYA